jgi:hypothetical protein
MSRENNIEDIGEEQLHAFFDGELEGEERERVERALAENPELGSQLDDLALVRDLLSGGGESSVAHVPQARFEQMWDHIDQTLDRDVQLNEAANRDRSLWSRICLAGTVQGPGGRRCRARNRDLGSAVERARGLGESRRSRGVEGCRGRATNSGVRGLRQARCAQTIRCRSGCGWCRGGIRSRAPSARHALARA